MTFSFHRCLGLHVTILNSAVFILLRCAVRFRNTQPSILELDFTAKFVFPESGC
jgi:hypothetical protein